LKKGGKKQGRLETDQLSIMNRTNSANKEKEKKLVVATVSSGQSGRQSCNGWELFPGEELKQNLMEGHFSLGGRTNVHERLIVFKERKVGEKFE